MNVKLWRKIALMLMLTLAACLLSAVAEGSYPESAHPYGNSVNQSWTYVHPTAADYLRISFSSDTVTEQSHDVIAITDAAGSRTEYSGTTLAGKSVYLQGGSFTISLTTDGTVTAYGFRITEIAAVSREEYEAQLAQPVFSVSGGVLTGYSGPNQVVIPEQVDGQTVTSIGSGAFQGSDVVSVALPGTVTSIGSYAFMDCASLAEICIPSSVKTIQQYAFANCTSLRKIQLCKGLLEIQYSAFRGCTALTSLSVPSGVTTIGHYAFNGCTALAVVELPEGLSSLGNGAFMYCAALTEAILPEGLTRLNENAFYGCSSLTQVSLPSGVLEIQAHAFGNCRKLTALHLPETVSSIGSRAFDGCAGLAEFAVPSCVTSIGSGAFDGNTVLRVGGNAYARQYAIDNGYQYISDAERVTSEGIDTVEEKIDWIVSNYLNDGMSEYQRALKLYDWLCMHVAYDHAYLDTDVPTGAHGVYGEGALLDGTAVCSGYAEAYKWLLERAGIESTVVIGVARSSGGAHAWNLARIDGEWYQFDATWDESGNGSNHNYFGLTDAAMEVDHRRDSFLGVRCNSWAANYNFRSGAYDESIDQLREAVAEKLDEGSYAATIRISEIWGPTDRQMLADILSADSWSLPGRVELAPTDSNTEYEMTFHPDETPMRALSLRGVDEQVNRYYMYPGYAVRLEAVTKPEGAAVRFVSLDEGVVSVDESGLATAVAEGTTELRAIAGGAVYRLSVTVLQKERFSFWAYFAGTEDSTACLDVGQTRQTVLCQWNPLLLDGAQPRWISEDESVATVDDGGLVTAVGYGVTTLSMERLGQSLSLKLIVRSPVRAVELEQHLYETVADGAQMEIYAGLDCADPIGYFYNIRNLSWMSSDESVLCQQGYTWRDWDSEGYYSSYGGIFDVKVPGVVSVTATARDESGACDVCTVVVHSATRMILPASLDRIEAEAFSGSAAEEFVLSEGVEAIESRAFAGCTSLKLLNLPSSVGEIADDAFEGCGALTLLCKEGSAGAAFAARLGIPCVCVP